MPDALRKTKIVATLGPATDSPETLRALIRAGANIFRLNMSHAQHPWVRQIASDIRSAAEAENDDVSILMDLTGPSIRTGDVATPLQLKAGNHIEFTFGDAAPELPLSVGVNYPGLGGDLEVGKTVLVDNGVLHMRVLEIRPDRAICAVLTDGSMGSRRHINLPGTKVSLPPLTEKDKGDLALGVDVGVDFFAMSFARNAEHIRLLKSMIQENGSKARVIAKIEDQEAIKNLEEIIESSDAVMVARGDLGIECHLEELPVIQRRIIQLCSMIGRKVIVATHMLESMIENPGPTRAEVTDVANAVYEQADAVMLSGETTVGNYPVKCVETLDRIARRIEVEETRGIGFATERPLATVRHRTAKSAAVLANSIEGSKLLVFTKRGSTAHLLAHQRPEHSPIYAFSPNLDTCRSLNLARSVRPFLCEFANDPEATVDAGIAILKKHGLVEPDDQLVILSDVLQGDYVIDSILLRKVRRTRLHERGKNP